MNIINERNFQWIQTIMIRGDNSTCNTYNVRYNDNESYGTRDNINGLE